MTKSHAPEFGEMLQESPQVGVLPTPESSREMSRVASQMSLEAGIADETLALATFEEFAGMELETETIERLNEEQIYQAVHQAIVPATTISPVEISSLAREKEECCGVM